MQDAFMGSAPRLLAEPTRPPREDARSELPRLSTLKWLVLGFGGFTANVGSIVQH